MTGTIFNKNRTKEALKNTSGEAFSVITTDASDKKNYTSAIIFLISTSLPMFIGLFLRKMCDADKILVIPDIAATAAIIQVQAISRMKSYQIKIAYEGIVSDSSIENRHTILIYYFIGIMMVFFISSLYDLNGLDKKIGDLSTELKYTQFGVFILACWCYIKVHTLEALSPIKLMIKFKDKILDYLKSKKIV